MRCERTDPGASTISLSMLENLPALMYGANKSAQNGIQLRVQAGAWSGWRKRSTSSLGARNCVGKRTPSSERQTADVIGA